MASKGTIPILYNEIAEKTAKDEIDVLYQVNAVSTALEQLGFKVSKHPFPGNPQKMLEALKETKPLLIFNLVEAVFGNGKLSYLAPSILEALNIKYTGNSAEAIFLTTNKIVTKKLLKFCGISTPQWITNSNLSGFTQGERYIIKPVYEDGSLGLLQDSIVNTGCISYIIDKLNLMKEETGKDFFAEKYIDGREVNISMLGENGRPLVLPPREIKFIGYKERNIEEILDYNSKWEEDSFEYKNTISSNIFADSDRLLINELEEISIRCWCEFKLRGYARVDFRIDKEGRPWVLEINANPCITPGGSGFMLSAEQMGLDYKDVVERIISEV